MRFANRARLPAIKTLTVLFPFPPNRNRTVFFCHTTTMIDPSPSSSSGPIRIDGSKNDVVPPEFDILTRTELLRRRSRRLKHLARIYRDHYWALMEKLKLKHREYYWEYGKSPFIDDEANETTKLNCGDCSVVIADNVNNGKLGSNGGISNKNVRSKCVVKGCKAKAMALTRFCHVHILLDSKQKLYEACCFSIKSSTAGPIICGKPTLRSTVPSYCSSHFENAEKIMARALKNTGLSVSSTSKLAPKFHVIIAEYVHQIQIKRSGKS